MFNKFKIFMETLEGYHPFSGLEDSRWKSVALGVYWLSLFLLTLSFLGRGAKFIYVDF